MSINKKPISVALLGFFLLAGLFSFVACGGSSVPIEANGYPLTYPDEVEHWATTYGIDPLLIYAIIRTESGFDSQARSTAGAIGLMQMTQDTFDWVKSKVAPQEELTFENLFEPDTSVRFGSYYFSYCMEKYGNDISTAAAAYHSGMGTVDSLLEDEKNTDDGISLHTFPYQKMAHYVKKVNDSYAKYTELYATPASDSAQSKA